MFLIFEILFLGWVLVQAVQVLRDGWAQTLIRFGILIIAFVGSSLLFALAGRFLPGLTANVVHLALGAVVVGIVGFYVIGALAGGWARKREVEKKLRARLRLGHIGGAAATVLLLAVFLAGAFFFADVLVNLAGAGRQRQMFEDQTLLAHRLLRPLPEPPAPADPVAPDQPAEMPPVAPPGGVFDLLTGGFEKARESVAQRVGAQRMVLMIAAIDELNSLPAEDRQWLIEETPELQRLLDNETIHAVIETEETMALVDRLAGGDIGALFQLGNDPRIKALFDDQELRDAVDSIDLFELRRRVREHQAEQATAAASPTANPAPEPLSPADEPAAEPLPMP